MKYEHSKMDNVIYTELNIQRYFMSEQLSLEKKRPIFHVRTRMTNKICQMHVDSQEHGVNCSETKKSSKKAANMRKFLLTTFQ